MRWRSRAKEMIEAHFKNLGYRGITGNMTAQLTIRFIRPHNHDQRIPAIDGADSRLDLQIAWIDAFRFQGNRVPVRRVRQHIWLDSM